MNGLNFDMREQCARRARGAIAQAGELFTRYRNYRLLLHLEEAPAANGETTSE